MGFCAPYIIKLCPSNFKKTSSDCGLHEIKSSKARYQPYSSLTMLLLSIPFIALAVILVTGLYASAKPRRIPKGTKELPGPRGRSAIVNHDIMNKC